MFLVVGILAALHARASTGTGQVVDAAMVDGAAYLMTMTYRWFGAGRWTDERGANLLDGGAPFYRTYRCRDGRYVAVGAIEPRFYAALLEGLAISKDEVPAQMDRSTWPKMKELFAARFAARTREEWEAHFSGTEACVAPVLTPLEAVEYPHNRARSTFVEVAGTTQPAPAPRFSRTPSSISAPPEDPGRSTDAALERWGIDPSRIASLRAAGALG